MVAGRNTRAEVEALAAEVVPLAAGAARLAAGVLVRERRTYRMARHRSRSRDRLGMSTVDAREHPARFQPMAGRAAGSDGC